MFFESVFVSFTSWFVDYAEVFLSFFSLFDNIVCDMKTDPLFDVSRDVFFQVFTVFIFIYFTGYSNSA